MKLFPLVSSHVIPLLLLRAASFVAGCDVIVVGAGAAGLRAAQTILNRDPSCSVLILEATSRHGGRVYSSTLGDTRVEMGGEEHYGPNGGNPVHEALVGQWPDIYVPAFTGSYAYAMPDGPGGLGTCATITYPESTGGLSNNCADDPDWTKFVGIWDWYWKPSQFQKEPSSTVEEQLASSRNFFKDDPNYSTSRGWFAYNAEFGAEFGTTVDAQGAHDLAVADFEWPLSEGVLQNVKGFGYSDALDEVWWQDTISKATMMYDSPVTKIDLTPTGVAVTVSGSTTFEASQVIVAVPIGVLQTQPGDVGHIEFNPPLPANTVQAINNIGFDQGMKVAIKFNAPACSSDAEPWWVNAVGGQVDWIITANGSCWPANYKAGSFDRVLMCFIMGDNAAELTVLPDEEKVMKLLADLDTMFDGAPASGCYSPAPENYLVQDWGAHPYTRGAYSFQGPNTINQDGGFAYGNARVTLQEPIQDRIFFTGEATALSAHATVVGAVFEGERAGNAVSLSSTSQSPSKAPTNVPPCVGGGVPCTGGCAECCHGYSSNKGNKTCNNPNQRGRGIRGLANDSGSENGGGLDNGNSGKSVDRRGADMYMASKGSKKRAKEAPGAYSRGIFSS